MFTFSLFITVLSVISSSLGESDDTVHSRIRLLIVTGENATDGYRRLFRTARGINLPAQMISVKDKTEEIQKILEVIQESPYRPDDVVVVINSEHYIVTQEPVASSLMIIMETVKQEASLLLASSLHLQPHKNNEEKDFTQEIQETNAALQKYRDDEKGAIKPRSAEDAEDAEKLLDRLKKLAIEERQNFRDSTLYATKKNFKEYAFAGLVSAVIDVLESLREQEKVLSVKDMWKVSEDLTLRHKYSLGVDDDYIIFQNARTINTDKFQYRIGHDGEVVLHGLPNIPIAPFIYASTHRMPFIPANLMAKEIGDKKACPECSDEPLPPRTLPPEDVPSVHLIVLIEREIPFIRLLMDYIRVLAYPRKKMYISFYVSTKAKAHFEEVEDFLKQEAESYGVANLLHPTEEVDDSDARNFLLQSAQELNPDYIFIIEGNAHLTTSKIIQKLMNKRRNIVGPLLKTSKTQKANIMTEVENDKFIQGSTYGNYILGSEDKHMTFKGLMQVPQVTGAVFLSRQVYPFAMFASSTPKESIWDPFYDKILSQGFIPYVFNEGTHGYLIDEAPELTPDIWNIDLNAITAANIYFTSPEDVKVMDSDLSSHTDEKESRKCLQVSKENVFKTHFVDDLLEDIGKSAWKVSSLNNTDGTEILEVPEEYVMDANVYVQSVLRYLSRNMEIPETGGRFQVMKTASGNLPLVAHTMVALVGLEQEPKVSMIEIDEEDDEGTTTSCLLKLREGETALLARNEVILHIIEPTIFAIFSI